jgi:hypothetical protein
MCSIEHDICSMSHKYKPHLGRMEKLVFVNIKVDY